MIRILAIAALVSTLASLVQAQERRPSHCISLVRNDVMSAFLHKATFGEPLEKFTIRLNYVSHATFLLETAGGATVATDYTGFLGAGDFFPDVVTMNRAHSSHWTDFPDPRIPNVLPGWNPEGGAADHHLEVKDLLVRNVPTDIRSGLSEMGRDGNSIFVFEVAGLCVGHLGHLHHEPTPEQYAALGRLDIVMVPVDGGMTLDLPSMIRVVKRLRSSIVIPMHWFGFGTLDRFLVGMSDEFAVERPGLPWLEVSLRDLPDRPTVIVLEPMYLPEIE